MVNAMLYIICRRPARATTPRTSAASTQASRPPRHSSRYQQTRRGRASPRPLVMYGRACQ